MCSLLSLLLPLALQLTSIFAAPTKRFASNPAIPANFPDPALIQANNNWYAFGTNNGKFNVQIARSGDFNSWAILGKDALPTLPPWASGSVWAPDIIQRVGI
jgi:beta-xylosidase